MADISQVNLPNGSSYNVKDANALHNITVPDYDTTLTYSRGDFVTYEGSVYICTTAIEEPEVWNSNHWRLVDADQSYLHSLNPKGAGSFSLNRKANTRIGYCSFAEGCDTTASGADSHAEGYNTTATGQCAHAEGSSTTATNGSAHAEGYSTSATGGNSHAEGQGSVASGYSSHAEGYYTKANHRSQHTFGEYNVEDPSTDYSSYRGNYVEIVGNGTAGDARSNARTLDWNGNEVLAGGLKINGTQNVATQVSLTQAEYDALVQAGTVDLVNTVYFITDGNANANSASETIYDNTSSGLSATNVQDAIDEIDSRLDGKEDKNTTTTGTITASTNVTLIRPNAIKWGKVKTLTCVFKVTGTTSTIGTIPSGFEPTNTIDFSVNGDSGHGCRLQIISGYRTIAIASNPTQNEYYAFTITYI